MSLRKHCLTRPHTKQRKMIYGHYDATLENKIDHINIYNKHFKEIVDFFKERDNTRLLILNTKDINKENKICDFINIKFNINNYIKFPHYHKTK